MSDLLNIIIRAMLLENLALVFLLGMCTFLAVSQRVSTAIGLGIAVIAVQTITVPINALVYQWLLAPGALAWAGYPDIDLSYIALVSFIGVIAAAVQTLEITLERFVPKLHARLGIYLPLLTVNCAILGGSLLMMQRSYSVTESVAYGLGSGLGWALAIIVFAAIRERLRASDIPQELDGLGIAFIVTGMLALGCTGLAGLAS